MSLVWLLRGWASGPTLVYWYWYIGYSRRSIHASVYHAPHWSGRGREHRRLSTAQATVLMVHFSQCSVRAGHQLPASQQQLHTGRINSVQGLKGQIVQRSRCAVLRQLLLHVFHYRAGRGRGTQGALSPWSHTSSLALTNPGAAERLGSHSLTHFTIAAICLTFAGVACLINSAKAPAQISVSPFSVFACR
jgi:hypothetical protein